MEIDNKTKGSWLVHHTNKLQGVTNQSGYENIFLAGKSGILLSAISQDSEATLNKEKLNTLAKASNINLTFELPKLIEVLQQRQLIDVSSDGGVAVLGITTTTALEHTANLYHSLDPTNSENSTLHLAEKTSDAPCNQSELVEEISDLHRLPRQDAISVLSDSERIGIVDSEPSTGSEKLFFNGNLFRRDSVDKISRVLESLKPEERNRINEFSNHLKNTSCVEINHAKKVLGDKLYSKVCSIGLFDINIVANSSEEAGFITLPSAFCKYSNSQIEDAFDLAKAFVSSLTYGMTKSSYARGEITMIEALLKTLIAGRSVGPVRAIGEDYRILELKGVVQVYEGTKKGRIGPMMKLLKREVGELALRVITTGSASDESLQALPSAIVNTYVGPETNRESERRKIKEISPNVTTSMLSTLRKGGI